MESRESPPLFISENEYAVENDKLIPDSAVQHSFMHELLGHNIKYVYFYIRMHKNNGWFKELRNCHIDWGDWVYTPLYVMKYNIPCRALIYPNESNEHLKVEIFKGLHARRSYSLNIGKIKDYCNIRCWYSAKWKLDRKTRDIYYFARNDKLYHKWDRSKQHYNLINHVLIHSYMTDTFMFSISKLIILGRRAQVRHGRRNLALFLRSTSWKNKESVLCQLAGTINTPVKKRIAGFLTGSNYKGVLSIT